MSLTALKFTLRPYRSLLLDKLLIAVHVLLYV